MSDLKAKLKADLIQSMKARDAARTQTLRTILSGVQKKEIAEEKDLLDDGVEKVMTTFLKQLQETIDQAKSLGRAEIVAQSEAEIVIVREYLPKGMSDAEVEQVITSIVESLKSAGQLPQGGAAIGAVMKQVIPKIGSRADGKTVQTAVRKALGLG